jgi:hypothetical protein
MVGLPLIALALFALVVTLVHALQARDFERHASVAPGIIARTDLDPAAVLQHVSVGFRLDARTVIARAPVADPRQYQPGQEVKVLYDPDSPEHVVLDEERYNAATPALLWSAILAAGLLTAGMGWAWIRRLRRTAAGGGPAFAMQATVAEQRPRWWNRPRLWVTLRPLDAQDPVGAYPLMKGIPARFGLVPVEVKGTVRDGGLVVARTGDGIGDGILWPRGRLRA